MELSNIILRTADIDQSTEFWSERVGLAIKGQMSGFTFLDAGPIPIILSAIDEIDDESKTEVVFRSNDVRATFREMSGRGVPFESELTAIMAREGEELLSCSFRDPDGHYGALQGWVVMTAD